MKRILALVLVGLLMASIASAAGLTVTKRFYTTLGTKKMVTARLLFDSSYPAGGEALTAATLGLSNIEWAIVVPDSIGADATGAGPYSFGYDVVNSTVFVCGLEEDLTWTTAAEDSTGSVSLSFEEMDAATDLSTMKVRIMAFGK